VSQAVSFGSIRSGGIVISLPGAPRTKKTSQRVLRFGKRNKIVPSKAFIAYQNACVAMLQAARVGCQPDAPMQIRARFFRDKRTGDLLGYAQGIADVLQKAGVISDDKWLLSWDGSRLDHDPKNPRVDLVLTALL